MQRRRDIFGFGRRFRYRRVWIDSSLVENHTQAHNLSLKLLSGKIFQSCSHFTSDGYRRTVGRVLCGQSKQKPTKFALASTPAVFVNILHEKCRRNFPGIGE